METFSDWYLSRHGRTPFPWQARLAERIAADHWPDALTPPTASGKTGVIDAWLWAWQCGHPVPRRLVYVIDRRLVVDGVTDYARDLAASLPEAERPAIVTLRGGMTIDEDWVLDPTRPAIVVSTVDQAGSRLLFRGYGIHPRSAPIHAALLGNDALWVLDEVHLAQPFLQTLERVARLRGRALPLPWRVLPMSATWNSDQAHGLADSDFEHPLLAQRLARPKPARLIKLKETQDATAVLIQEAVGLREEGAEVVAVVCNRVARARAVFEGLRERGDALLLTGRIRPADREILMERTRPLMAGRRRGRSPVFVVATQTIEVGADLDFDGLVTEHAPVSALRQRAGRLNRLGELPSAPMRIVYRPDKEDPVYGKPFLDAAWKWLGKVATGRGKAKCVDFGIRALDSALASHPAPAEDRASAPLLLESHLDLLASNIPLPRLEIAPWLRGWERGTAEVYLCWRADWGEESLTAAPPRQHELLAIPLGALRRWSEDIADIEDVAPDASMARNPLECLRWTGERAERITAGEARPGDTLVLHSEVGGHDALGWAPRSRQPVTDVGDDERRVRLHADVHPELADEIAALLDSEAQVSDWHRLAQQAGLERPGRVLAIPKGRLVLSRGQWTSDKAYRAIPLTVHSDAVAESVARTAQTLKLPREVRDGLRQAGRDHDTGKADLRWQAGVGGDGEVPLAKGPRADDPWLTLPPGWRHEMESVARLDGPAPLTRYLVGTHHGYGRPLFPMAPDPKRWRQMEDWPELRTGLLRDWGHWGLALLETLLRLADWTVSDAEQHTAPEETP
ncbi:type I-G CRISPR-associated helicase/endonuclease Cas3g [Imhoffiella purpurea]|uniref:HD Cas3-type domain-containing protein n=1 Tax=Imhoffiella purpurea TaxID=1249627 RepID=W9V2Q0_9GAMM|nr:type I-U CRISPR-associated helicase/endonuclease Cas3 [Imhoffiella purpurea]EXJ13609.1 hypothetical protein D779_3501 [Imhoffiella purpurea]